MKKVRYISTVLASVLIASCGGSGQDSGSSDSSSQIRGAAIDGYVARGRVYIDSDGDNVIDSFELQDMAFTDDDGYISYNPITGVDYCAPTATESQRVFCLESSINVSNSIIRLVGGYDLSTGLPFTGTLSLRTGALNSGESVNALLTPISSLVSEIEDDTERSVLIEKLGISEEDLAVDFFSPTDANGNSLQDNSGNALVDGRLVNLAQKIHKVVETLSENIEVTYDKVGDEEGLPADTSVLVYQALAEQLSSSEVSLTLDALVENSTEIGAVIDNVDDSLRTLYMNEGLTPPTEIIANGDLTGVSDLLSQVSDLPDVIDQLVSIDPAAEVTLDAVTGSVRAIQVLTEKISEQRDSGEIGRLTDILENDTSGLRDDLLTALARDDADVSGLVSDGINFTDANDVSEAAVLPSTAVPFTQLPGQELMVSDPNLKNNTQDVEVIFYFVGEAGDTSGTLHVCAKYIEDVENGQISEASTTGRYARGDWSLLVTAADPSVGYSVLARFEDVEEGLDFQTILKSTDVNGQGAYLYEFDLGDDGLASFESVSGVVVQSGDIPSTDTACKALLPSRIGL